VILSSSTARRSFAVVTLLGLGVPMAQSSVLASFVRTLVPAKDVTSNVGRLFSGIAIFGALAALLAARLLERHGTTRVLTASCLCAGALLVPQGVADEMWQLAPFVVAVAFFQGGVQTATVRLISNTISRSDSGVGFGIYQSIQVGAAQIGPFLGGALADSAGFRAVFPIAGVVLIASGTLAAFALPKTVAPTNTLGDQTPL
jgi:MFS family permease